MTSIEDAILTIRGHLEELRPDDPAELVARIRSLHLELDDLTVTAVEAQRQHGMSWSQIGRQLGMTKQAAQQRFGANRTD